MSLEEDLKDNDFESVFKDKILPTIGGIGVVLSIGYGLYKVGEFFYDYVSDFVNYINDYWGF